MKVTSRTGLIASKTNKLLKQEQPQSLQLQVIATSAPYILKPYAGLYSPYPYSCSLLCNHPADDEARELVKKAKDTWATEGKSLLLAEEIEAIKASFNALQIKVTDYDDLILHENDQLPLGCVPEELFRKYTETDSRPLTPAPTLASAHTRASGSRRCVTPDPMSATQVREKTLLVLDLRRSHSQETISWHSSSLQQRDDLPSITIMKATTERRAISALNFSETETPRKKKDRSNTTPSPIKLAKIDLDKISKSHLSVASTNPTDDENETTDDEDVIRRRGKKRRKRGRDLSHDPPGIQSSVDPETQIETIGPDSHNPSARPSLVPDETPIIGEVQSSTPVKLEEVKPKVVTPQIRRSSLSIDSFLDIDSLKLLRRELNEEVIDNEFNLKRRRALEEALKTIRHDKPVCDEMITIRSELKLVPIDDNVWVNIPRTFSRSSARFELPMDSRQFGTMTPLEYVKEHVYISTSRKQLYNFIFNRNKIENELENEPQQRLLAGTSIEVALNEMMGKSMTEKQMNKFRDLVGWKDEDVLDFKTFCGLCALCERILAPEYYSQLPNRKKDPCNEIEAVDFQSLSRRLSGQNADERLVRILYAIKEY